VEVVLFGLLLFAGDGETRVIKNVVPNLLYIRFVMMVMDK
jgi:hypothetical protein